MIILHSQIQITQSLHNIYMSVHVSSSSGPCQICWLLNLHKPSCLWKISFTCNTGTADLSVVQEQAQGCRSDQMFPRILLRLPQDQVRNETTKMPEMQCRIRRKRLPPPLPVLNTSAFNVYSILVHTTSSIIPILNCRVFPRNAFMLDFNFLTLFIYYVLIGIECT